MPHGTFYFISFPGYGFYVSWTATLLFSSYIMHNIVAWLKVKPFFIGKSPRLHYRTGKTVQWGYCIALCLTVPVWIFNAYNNFQWNINTRTIYRQARPLEFIARDPWRIFTNVVLLHIIGRSYGISVLEFVSKSPRLGILALAIVFAITFTVVDIVAAVLGDKLSNVDGINPFWKLSLVLKCLVDAIMLDDFTTELRQIGGERAQPIHTFEGHRTSPMEDPEKGPARRDAISATLPAGRELSMSNMELKTSTTPGKPRLSNSLGHCIEMKDIGRLAS